MPIYRYLFTRDERRLGIRAFDGNTRREVYERQQGICPACEQHFEIEPYHAVVERRTDDSRATAKCCARNAIDGSRIKYYPKKRDSLAYMKKKL